MKNTLIKRILLIALVVALAFIAVAPLERTKQDASDWMSNLSDETALAALSIPGTHDSGATHSIADVAGKCQALSIEEQLKCGVRFFDIRLKLVKDSFRIVHSFVDQKTTFLSVLNEMIRFLEENPSEFLLLSIKEDDAAVDAIGSFNTVLETLLLEDESGVICTDRHLPNNVKDARGKIFIIARYADSTIGIPAYYGWLDSTSFALDELYVQDNYAISDVKIKLMDIQSAFYVANKMEHALVLNFTSCYLTSGFPPTYAATPARKINAWLNQNLSSTQGPLGVLVCDFITSELAQKIIGRNFA